MIKIAVSRYSLDHKIPSGHPAWAKFNASFDNVDIPADKIMDDIYAGHAVTTQHRNNWRTSANYLCGQHLALDFDSGDTRSEISTLVKDKFIAKYANFIHTTISHTPEAPRARVYFILDVPIMQARNYARAASALLWLFGAADRQCKDPARFFYGAPKCTIEPVYNFLPLDVVQKLIKNYEETGKKEHKRAARNDYLPRPDQQEVAEALKMIPPWNIDYDEWVQVLMAIHSEFGDGGYALAEAWADGYPGEVERKWNSFHAEGNPQGVVTIGTLFSIAKKFGWGGIHGRL